MHSRLPFSLDGTPNEVSKILRQPSFDWSSDLKRSGLLNVEAGVGLDAGAERQSSNGGLGLTQAAARPGGPQSGEHKPPLSIFSVVQKDLLGWPSADRLGLLFASILVQAS